MLNLPTLSSVAVLPFLLLGERPSLPTHHEPRPANAPSVATVPAAPPRAAVSIVRDTYGVPHVYSSTDEGALYGLGYAQAQDRLFQMYYERAAYQGRIAQYFGKGAVLGSSYAHIEHDRTARIVGWERQATAVVAAMDAATLQLLVAFCDGVNAYVATPGAVVNPLFGSTGIPLTPWTPVDCVGSWYRFGRFFANLGLEEGAQRARVEAMQLLGWTEPQIAAYLGGTTVCDDTATVITRSDVPSNISSAMAAFANQAGVRNDLNCLGGVLTSFSQAIVARGSKVSTGEALLLAEPRLPVFVPNSLYEASVSGATIQVRGACLPGTANFIVGSTPHQAWGVTALGVDQADLFRLVTDPVNFPGQYFLDGAWRPYDLDTTTVVQVKNDPLLNQTLTIRETFFGPVVTEIVDDCETEPAIGIQTGCTNGADYSLRAVPFAVDGQDAFKGYLGMYRAPDMVNFLRATEELIWPSMNMVVAASSGSIAYIANGACPVRKANEFLAGFMAQDGSASTNDWQTYLPHHLKPWVIDPAADFLVTANHRPIGSWYPLRSLYPGLGDTTRSWRLRELLSTTPTFTPQAFADIHLDRVLPTARDLTLLGKHLRDVQGYPLSTNARNALRALIPWQTQGARMDATAGGVAVAHFLRRTLRNNWVPSTLTAAHGAGQSGMSHFLRSAIKKITGVPPQNLAADEATAVEFTLAEAQSMLPAAAGTTGASMLQWYVDQFLTGSTASNTGAPFGYGRQQEGFPAWDPSIKVSFGPLIASDGDTNLSQKGDSFTQFVRPSLTDGATTVLAIGVSEHPSSPWFTNQKALWESGQLKPAPQTLAGVQAMGSTQTTNLTYP